MTDNLKRFLEEASKDAELVEKIGKADSVQTIIALAAEKGFNLTEEEMKQPSNSTPIMNDELDAVAGGKDCMCTIGGGGEAGLYSDTCACVLGGVGLMTDGESRCMCALAGAGDDDAGKTYTLPIKEGLTK